jgi:DnaJ-class molecular chaperone
VSDGDIKKSYRRLALELHPDKIPMNCSEAEKEILTAKFIDIQNAYETLGNAESRLRYDLSTQGIEYSVREAKQTERYMTGNFVMFAKSKHIKVLFEANFAKKDIPEISINVAVSARDLFKDLSGNVSFYRSVKCKTCAGNGGANGSCSTCSFCGGTGSAQHLFHDDSNRYQQMTHTGCGLCGGRGCVHDHGQCPACKGSGFVMELASIAYHLKRGFSDGSELTFSGIGHEDLDGDVGTVKLRFMLSFPPMWSIEAPLSLNLVYTMYVPFKDIEKGLKRDIISISGEKIKVKSFFLMHIYIYKYVVILVNVDYFRACAGHPREHRPAHRHHGRGRGRDLPGTRPARP